MTGAFSLGTWFLGALALAGGLFLLQRLRVRHRPVVVVSTLFWQEALQEARARVLVQRFRHLLTYLLLLAITLLLWTAMADPHASDPDAREYVVLVDGSAAMGVGQRWANMVEQLDEVVAGLPRDQRRVLFCGGTVTPLLLPGEASALLSPRSGELVPEAASPTIEDTLLALARQQRDVEMTVLVAGAAPVRSAVLDQLPETFSVQRIATASTEPGNTPNRGIVALGATPALSGLWDRVDVFVETYTGAGSKDANRALELSVTIDDEAPSELVREGVASTLREQRGYRQTVFRDLPANGALFAVSLAATDGTLVTDDTAQLRLPLQQTIRVQLSPALESLASLLAVDPAIERVDARPDVVLRRGGESVGGNAPALEFVPATAQDDAFLIQYRAETGDGGASRDVIDAAFDRLGLEQIDTTELAEELGAVITLGARAGTQRAIGVWEELLSEQFNFRQSRSFPLFVAMAIRYLAEQRDFTRTYPVGRPITKLDTARLAENSAMTAVGDDFRPPLAGRYAVAAADGESEFEFVASVLDPNVTAPAEVGGAELAAFASAPEGSGRNAVTLLGLLALLLLVVEWHLLRRGRIP